jgi:hypothetical protein
MEVKTVVSIDFKVGKLKQQGCAFKGMSLDIQVQIICAVKYRQCVTNISFIRKNLRLQKQAA